MGASGLVRLACTQRVVEAETKDTAAEQIECEGRPKRGKMSGLKALTGCGVDR